MQTKIHKYSSTLISFVIILVLYIAVSGYVSLGNKEMSHYYLPNEWTVTDESGERTANTLSDIHFHLKKGDNVTLSTTMPELTTQHPMIKLWFYHAVFSVKLDGESIYESGVNEQQKGKMVPNGVFFVPLPDDFSGKTLEINFTSQINNAFSALPNIALQQESVLMKGYYRSDIVQIAIGFFLLIVGVLFLMTMILYRKNTFVTRKLLFISSISLLASCWLFISSRLFLNLIGMKHSYSELEYILLYITPLVVVLYVLDRQTRPLFQQICKIIIGVCGAFFVGAVLLHVAKIINYAEVLLLFHFILVAVLGCLLWFTIYNCFVIKDNSEVIFLRGLVAMIVLLLFDIIRFNVSKFITTSATDTNDIIIPISILILVFSMVQSSMAGILKTIEANIAHEVEKRISNKDNLTGLLARSRCVDYLNETTEDAMIVCFDIKNLGKINEIYGPSHGDNYLTSFAYSLKSVFKQADLIGRIGDDEFIVVQKEMTSNTLKDAISLLKDTVKVAVVDEENPLAFYYEGKRSKEHELWKCYESLQKKIVNKKNV